MGKVQLPTGKRLVWLIALSIPLIVFFQNCSSAVQFKAISSIAAKGLNLEGGNGDGYGGKPDAHYYHFLPEFRCDGNEHPRSEIHETTASITFIENLRVQCGANTSFLLENDVDRSPHRPDIVGYRDMIFEKKDESVSTSIPDDLVEAWCFDDPVSKSLEVRHTYNRKDQKTTLEVLGQLPDRRSAARMATNIARLVEQRSVRYTSDSYELIIDKDKYATVGGQYIGSLSTTFNGTSYQIQLSCRLGGYLDARLWPAKMLFDGNIQQYDHLASADRSVGLLGKSSVDPGTLLPIATSVLLEADLSKNAIRALTPLNPRFMGILDFKLKSDQTGAVYRTDEYSTGISIFRMAEIDFSNAVPNVLSSEIAAIGQGVSENYQTTVDGWIFYQDAHQEPWREIADFEPWLWSSAPRTTRATEVFQINQNLPLHTDTWISEFWINSSSKRVVYAIPHAHDMGVDLFSTNYDGTDRRQLSSGGFAANIFLSYQTPFFAGEHREIFGYWVVAGSSVNLVMAKVDGSGTGSIELGLPTLTMDSSSLRLSPNGLLIYIRSAPSTLSPGLGILVKLPGLSRVQVPWLAQAQFDSNSQTLYGIDANNQFNVIDVASGLSQQVCSEFGKLESYTLAEDGNTYLVARSSEAVSIVRYDRQSCNPLNRLPKAIWNTPTEGFGETTGVDLTSPGRAAGLNFRMSLAPDGASALLLGDQSQCGIRGISILCEKHSMLLWIPFDGRAPVRVDAPTGAWGNVLSYHFSSDSKKVIYHGRQFENPNEKQVMVWDVPR